MDVIELTKKEMLRRRYSLRTIKTYIFYIKYFLKHCHKEPRKFTKKDITDYLNKLSEKNKSGSTININLQALKFMMENILNKRRWFYNIKYSKVPKELPTVLEKEEIINLINSIENKKHLLMIKILYSAGLRVSELVHLKVGDLDLINNYGWVRKGKGNKDRLFIIADSLKQEITEYIAGNKHDHDSFVFKSYKGCMSPRTIQEIIKKAAKKSKINKKVHPHTLRHSYATHLIENGYDLVSVQSLLGHNSAETTRKYLHISSPTLISVKSPIDSLNLDKTNDLQPEKDYTKFTYEFKNFEGGSILEGDYNNIRI